VQKKTKLPYLSLGWKTHVARYYNTQGSYSADDVNSMIELINEYDLVSRSGLIVFAVNFRIMREEESRESLRTALAKVANSQLLLWTGTGEPPVREADVMELKADFKNRGFGDRIGFDVQIASSWWEGVVAETKVVGINVINKFRDLKQMSSSEEEL